jgi:hypothetical protein
VTERVYPGRPHTILAEEIAEAARVVFGGDQAPARGRR